VHAIDIPGSLNTILVATIQETTSDNLALNQSIAGTVDPLLDRALLTAMNNIVPATAGEIVFTDERAPVETIIDSLVLGYLLEEGPAGLPGLGG
ncbi:MAG: hypothetical protein KDE28_04950, partial [Anaerolineales bacterium]|nr:hypothetical protein [Anaerolineales bacterium]